MKMKFFLLPLFAVLMAANCPTLFAQNFETNYIKYSSSGIRSDSDADFIDYDGDGKLDILAGYEETKHLLWMENQDVTFKIQALTDSLSGITFVKELDYNRDGYSDFLLSLRIGTRNDLFLFINDSSYQYDPHFVFSTGFEQVDRIEMGDFNADGDLDFFVDVEGSSSYFFFVESAGNFQFNGGFSPSLNGPDAMLFGVDDLDGDGFADVLGISQDFGVFNQWVMFAFETDTSLSSNFIIHYLDTVDRMSRGVVADFGGSAAPDLMVSLRGQPTDAIYYQNNGNFNFSPVSSTRIPNTGQVYLPGDYDNDNDIDVIAFSFLGLDLIVNNGNGTFSTQVLKHDYIGAPVAWEDINGDGRKDLLTNAGSYIATWTQDANGNYNKFWANNDAGEDFLQVFDADLNGKMDLISSDGTDLRVILQSPDEKFLPTIDYVPSALPVSSRDIDAAVQLDKDGDGDMDLFVDHQTSVYWLTNNQGTFTASVIENNINGVSVIKKGDLDRDGNPDIIVPTNRYERFEWNGNSFSRSSILENSRQFAFADLDNDNDDDIFFLTQDITTRDFELRYMRNNNNTFVNTFIKDVTSVVGNGANGIRSRMEAGDIDQDGDQDFFLTSFGDGEVIWFRNDSNLVFTEFVLTDSIIQPGGLHVEDMDNDGDMDIVVVSENFGRVYVFNNDGNENFTENLISEDAAFPENIEVTDFDQDGDMDILTLSGPDHKLYWFENLTINCTRSFTRDTVGICFGDSLLIGGIWRKTAGAYADTLTTLQGCDSILDVSLQIFSPPSTVQTKLCFGDSLQIGNQWVTTTGTYQDSLRGSNGCDSLVTIVLEVVSAPSSAVDSICVGDSLWIGNQWITSAGIYTDTLMGSNGCDSLHTIELSIFSLPDIAIDTVRNTVYATQMLNSYMWYKNDTLLASETRDSLDASAYGDGQYHLIGRNADGCLIYSDTLDVSIIRSNVSLEESQLAEQITIYPNPVEAQLIIEFSGNMPDFQGLRLYTLAGKEIEPKQFEVEQYSNRVEVQVRALPKGFYLMRLQLGNTNYVRKVVKE